MIGCMLPKQARYQTALLPEPRDPLAFAGYRTQAKSVSRQRLAGRIRNKHDESRNSPEILFSVCARLNGGAHG